MNDLDFKFDAEVYGLDKQCGHLAKIAMDPTAWHITSLIIESGFLLKRARVIPITKVEGVMAEAIYVAINNDELDDYPEYEEVVVEEIVTEWQRSLSTHDVRISEPHYAPVETPEIPAARGKVHTGVAEELVLLDNHTPVEGVEGPIGQISRIITAENFQISQFVVTQGRLLLKPIAIPVHLVETINEYRIQTTVTEAEIDQLLEFDPS